MTANFRPTAHKIERSSFFAADKLIADAEIVELINFQF
jgi:hypothetical protein